MKNFIKLGFIGIYKVDLLHYLSQVLHNINKEVIVVDASKEQYIECTLLEDQYNGVYNYKEVNYLLHKSDILQLNNIGFTEYDIALIDYGMNKELQASYQECDILFVITNFEKHNVLAIKNMVDGLNNKVKIVKIYRDIIGFKINKKYINYLLKLEENANVLAEYSFEFSEEDYRCKLSCQYDNSLSFKRLSRGYKILFADILEELYNFTPKDAMKVIKACEGGISCK